MGQTSVERHLWRRHLESKMAAPEMTSSKTWGGFFGPPLRWRWKMAALPLPVAILDDLISGSANEVIQDGGRKRKGRHFPPPPQWGSKKPPYTTDHYLNRWWHSWLRKYLVTTEHRYSPVKCYLQTFHVFNSSRICLRYIILHTLRPKENG